jgi:hypothetical protein
MDISYMAFHPNPPNTLKTRVQNYLPAEVSYECHRPVLDGTQSCSINFQKELPYEIYENPPKET